MKRNEIIELNGVEYTLELNRDSAIRIEQRTNLEKRMNEIQKPVLNYIEETKDGDDPFAEEFDYDAMQNEADKKLEDLKNVISTAFWIWLYPNHKLNISEVKEIVNKYFDTEDNIKFISEKYAEYMKLSTEINQEYMEERKNLKSQINK